jgi:hypothetical protein
MYVSSVSALYSLLCHESASAVTTTALIKPLRTTEAHAVIAAPQQQLLKLCDVQMIDHCSGSAFIPAGSLIKVVTLSGCMLDMQTAKMNIYAQYCSSVSVAFIVLQ